VKHLSDQVPGSLTLLVRLRAEQFEGDDLRCFPIVRELVNPRVSLLYSRIRLAPPLSVPCAAKRTESIVTVTRARAPWGLTARTFPEALQRAVRPSRARIERLSAGTTGLGFPRTGQAAIAARSRAIGPCASSAQMRVEDPTGVGTARGAAANDLTTATWSTCRGAVDVLFAGHSLKRCAACPAESQFTAALSNGVAAVRAVEVSRVRATSPRETGPADDAGLRGMLQFGATDRAELMWLRTAPTAAVRDRVAAPRPGAHDGWPRRDLRHIGTSARAVEAAPTGALVRRCGDCVYASRTLAGRRSGRPGGDAEALCTAVSVRGLLCPLAALLADPRGRVTLRHDDKSRAVCEKLLIVHAGGLHRR
jgi:hypothetical protein